MERKIGQESTTEQKEALRVMQIIAEYREMLPYIRKSDDGSYHKNFFKHYTEGFVCDEFDLVRAKENEKDYDALSKKGEKIQIKEVTHSAPTIKMPIGFDYLVTVKLSKKDFSVDEIGVYPQDIVNEHMSDTNKTFRITKKLKEAYVTKYNHAKPEIQD
ncbi:MAG: hypothetical protein NTY74_14780 [Ignavibacteriae bacterium]|nr:hypothetical protein [Ignavibacteriota bacterium]